jgi:cyclopropane-fatty-acyl-phospholipid synthase
VNAQFAHELSENGLVPDGLIRHGIRRMLRQRLDDIHADSNERSAGEQTRLVQAMRTAEIAQLPHKANEQHYEVPAAFYEAVLGEHLKYSCGYWGENEESLTGAENESLARTCRNAGIEDGMRILELGCGWGSLTLWMARHYPDCRITAVSNSRSQGAFIRQRAERHGLENVEVVTADMNGFEASGRFHRVVSVEMFEHMRNWPELFRRISDWLTPEGEFLMHIFTHRTTPYFFEDRGAGDWMSRHFFSGGMMPSTDLPLFFQDDLRLEQRWQWDGRHYEKTANAWLAQMDRQRDHLWPVLEQTYGQDFARTWWMRWRMFFMACAELFGFDNGQEWFVSHYRFSNRKGA